MMRQTGKRLTKILPVLLLVTSIMVGCGGANGMAGNGGGGRYDKSMVVDADYYAGGYDSDNRTDEAKKREMYMSYSYDVDIEIETGTNIDDSFEKIMDQVYLYNGYLDSKSTSYYDDSDGRMNFTVQVPNEKAEQFAKFLKDAGHVSSFSQQIKNRTSEYTRAESEGDQEEMMDIVHDTSFSDFDITLTSVKEFTDTRPSFWRTVKEGFLSAASDFVDFVADFLMEFIFMILKGLLIGIPCMLVLAVLVVVYRLFSSMVSGVISKLRKKPEQDVMTGKKEFLRYGQPYVMYMVPKDVMEASDKTTHTAENSVPEQMEEKNLNNTK